MSVSDEQLGDRVERMLTSMGITQEKWIVFKAKHGLPRGCNCNKRKQWLNEFGKQFGQAARRMFERK